MNEFERRMGTKKQHPAEMLKLRLASQSKKTNVEVEARYGIPDLLNADGTLDSKGYRVLYSGEEMEVDTKFVHEREVEFSGARIPNVQAFYRDEHGANTEDEIIAKWRDNKSREKNGQMEMAVTALLSEMLPEDFLIVRTAAYDDYKNGVDNLILDRKTGEVVGAFDEVHEGGDGRRTEEKKLKIQNIARKGGARIRYGLRLAEGKLTRASLEGVPVFYLGLESSELLELVQGLAENDSKKKEKIFHKLLSSLRLQHGELEKNANTALLRARLASFGQSLSRLDKTEQKAA